MGQLDPSVFEHAKLTDPPFLLAVLQTPLASVIIAGALMIYIIHTVLVPLLEPVKEVPKVVRALSLELKETNSQLKTLGDNQAVIVLELKGIKEKERSR